jgi:hypothetical protein
MSGGEAGRPTAAELALWETLCDVTAARGKTSVKELAAASGCAQSTAAAFLRRQYTARHVYQQDQPRLDRPTVSVWWLSPAGRRHAAAVRAQYGG